MTVDPVGKIKVQLMSRIFCVSHISARKADTLVGVYNWGFNIWISLYEGWKPEQKEESEVRACVFTAPLTPNVWDNPAPLLTSPSASTPALRTRADCPAVHSDTDFVALVLTSQVQGSVPQHCHPPRCQSQVLHLCTLTRQL